MANIADSANIAENAQRRKNILAKTFGNIWPPLLNFYIPTLFILIFHQEKISNSACFFII